MSLHALRLLLLKNFRLSYRDTGSLFITLACPFVVMLLMYFDQLNINAGSTFIPELLDDRNPTPRTITTIPPCTPRATNSCTTIAYSPTTDERVRRWIEKVADRNSIPENEIRGFENEDKLNNHFENNPNTTQAAYVFNEYSLNQLDNQNISFIIQYNTSTQRDFPLGDSYFDKHVIYPAMAHQMQIILMEEFSNISVNVNLNISVFPHPVIVEDELTASVDSFSDNGGLLTFATYFITLVFFLYRIVVEKERGLRDAMKIAGQSQFQHFVSWIVPFFVTNLLITLLLIGFGALFRFKIFLNIPFIIYFLTMLLFATSMISWTFLISSFISKSTSVSGVGFNFLIFGYIIASATVIVYLDSYKGPKSLRYVFAISPVTPFYRSLQYLAIVSNIPGFKMSMSDIGDRPSIFSIRTCWLWMLGSGIVALILAVYFDNIIPTPHGAPLPTFYFLQLSYWFPRKSEYLSALSKSQEGEEGDGEGDETAPEAKQTDDDSANGVETSNVVNGNNDSPTNAYNPDVEDEDISAEREAVASGLHDDAAVVIKNLTKDFGWFKKFRAVDNLSLSIPRNTAFALLGHNGAGKTITMKMLSTTLAATSGDAFIYGLSVKKQKESVRKLLGVCPQFDTFWDKLTGSEHIELFSALRGYQAEDCQKEIDLRLNDVDLLGKKDILAGNYSGGMQRRLSVAISLTGDPRVLFLDECSSGSDPLVRRDLWATIQRAKQGRVIFLITHSIAEAQYIAGHNRIGIMAKGKLRVLGNAMHLKTKFGAGHSMIVVLNDSERLLNLHQALVSVCHGVVIKEDSISQGEDAVVVKFLLPRGASELEILKVIEILEADGESFGVRDYSMDSTTLDEVFKSITSLSEDVREKGDD